MRTALDEHDDTGGFKRVDAAWRKFVKVPFPLVSHLRLLSALRSAVRVEKSCARKLGMVS